MLSVAVSGAADLHLDALLLAELGQRLLDAQRRETSRSVGVPALPHDLRHHAQSLNTQNRTLMHMNTHKPIHVHAHFL